MNVSEASQKWECSESTIRRYCNTGIIPTAYKSETWPHGWIIPDNCSKPPMPRHSLCFLLDAIICAVEGATIDVDAWGFGKEKTVKGYNYLIAFQFMTPINTDQLESELRKAVVTKRGEELIKRENKENNKTYRAYVKGKIDIGVAGVEIGTEFANI